MLVRLNSELQQQLKVRNAHVSLFALVHEENVSFSIKYKCCSWNRRTGRWELEWKGTFHELNKCKYIYGSDKSSYHFLQWQKLPSPFMSLYEWILYVIILALKKINLCGHGMRKCPFCRYNPIIQNGFEVESKTRLLSS